MKRNNEEQEINRKRKQNQQEEEDHLELKLSCSPTPSYTASPPVPVPAPVPHQQERLQMASQMPLIQTLFYEPPTSHPLQLSANHSLYNSAFINSEASSSVMYPPQELPFSPPPADVPLNGEVGGRGPPRNGRGRRNPTHALREGKPETVEAPYPWATIHRATVHSLQYLSSEGICTITGDVQCKRCERQYKIGYDLKDKFNEIATFIVRNKSSMHDRAPPVWRNPVLPKCKFCDQENSTKPVISAKKKAVNWLFLLLGQMLGCCTLNQLKYFCKHTKNHRTGAKDRLLYLTYLSLCKQLDPTGPFDRES